MVLLRVVVHVVTSVRFAEISELRRALDERQVSATELAEEAVKLLEATGIPLNAVAEITRDRALLEAGRADRRIGNGDTDGLLGIPWGAKDLLDTREIATRWGAPPFGDRVPDDDAAVVKRLSGHGAVLAAKLSLIELAGAGLYRYTAASLSGACQNPWNTARWAGGSSSGSAAAVAAGLVPFSIGSETGGSLVIPAAFCGVTALRPTFGTVSRRGAMLIAWTLDKLGPMAHSAADCETVFTAICGMDAGDASTHSYHYAKSMAERFRLGVMRDESNDDSLNAAFGDALEALRSAGADVTDVTLPPIDYRELHDDLVSGETAAALGGLVDNGVVEQLIDEDQKLALRACVERPVASYTRALEARAIATRAIDETMANLDALVAPTVMTEAVPIDTDLLEYRRTRRGGNMFLGSVAGLPELTMPMGTGQTGLPVAVSLIGKRFEESTILNIAMRFQEVTSWHRAHPTAATQ